MSFEAFFDQEIAILGDFLAIFGPINLYRNLPAGRPTPSHVIGHNFDSETLAQKVIPFWKALEIGYLLVLKKEKRKKKVKKMGTLP